MSKPIVSIERLKEALFYCPETGVFIWRIRSSDRIRIGDVAGWRRNSYRYIRLDGVIYPAHRLAWLYMTGMWPNGDIDHRDTERHNNCFSNLRDVSRQVNKQNRRTPQANNASGFLGVSRDKKAWCMQIKLPDGSKIRKNYKTPEEAHAAYLEGKRLHHEGNTL